jgi:hypothetical protein
VLQETRRAGMQNGRLVAWEGHQPDVLNQPLTLRPGDGGRRTV